MVRAMPAEREADQTRDAMTNFPRLHRTVSNRLIKGQAPRKIVAPRASSKAPTLRGYGYSSASAGPELF
jgi:hypothetical protein